MFKHSSLVAKTNYASVTMVGKHGFILSTQSQRWCDGEVVEPYGVLRQLAPCADMPSPITPLFCPYPHPYLYARARARARARTRARQ